MLSLSCLYNKINERTDCKIKTDIIKVPGVWETEMSVPGVFLFHSSG